MTKSIARFEGFAHLCFFPSSNSINCEYDHKSQSNSTSNVSAENAQALESNSAENRSRRVKCSQNLSSNSHEKPLYFKGHMIFEEMTMQFALRGIPSATAPPDAYDHGCLLDKPVYYDVTIQDYDAKQKWEFKWVRWWGGDAGWMSSDPKCCVTGERVVVSEQESASEEQFIWFSTTLIKGNEEAQKHVKKYLNMKIDEEEIDISHVCIGEMRLIVETEKVEDEFESFDDESESVCNHEILDDENETDDDE
ncbi:23433_t:CDS:1 [Dentiscutata erythropus]|uniref:23433_t:CDS:1 n=1 Tax=Dentiscutata erythropus TaxID=1348616 RepID=A0A9N9C9B4_9GLOM|nr:23433_t:CDS:1 [Dentiscutata erythropus]